MTSDEKGALGRFADMRFGLMIHWGPAVLTDEEISWSMSNRRNYEKCFAAFDPQSFDADQCAAIATAAGMKYAIYVCKHHDGFCMWDTETTDVNVMNTPMKRDVVGEFAEACRRRKVRFGAYLSIMDIHEANWDVCYPLDAVMPGYPEGIPHILDLTTRQGLELVRKYRPEILWFDGCWLQGWDEDAARAIDLELKKADPNLLTCNLAVYSNRPGEPWDYENNVGDYPVMEAKIGRYMQTPWEVVTSVAYPLYSFSTELEYKSVAECVQMLSRIACSNGNLLLNFIPDRDGAIPAEQKEIAKGIGEWLECNGDAVYGTRGGPWYPGRWGGSTRKGKRIYLHLTSDAPENLHLSPPGAGVVAMRALNGMPTGYTQTEAGLEVRLPGYGRDPKITVLALTMDKEVRGMLQYNNSDPSSEGTTAYGTVPHNESGTPIRKSDDDDPHN